MSATTAPVSHKSNRVDGIFATVIVGLAIIVSGLTMANASTDIRMESPANNVHTVITSGSSEAGATITVSGSAGLTL